MRLFFMGPRVFGIRPGIIVRPGELLRFFSAASPRATKTVTMTGAFVYVFKGDHNLVKVGVSTNPDARLAQLRTASPFPIDYAYVGVTPGTGYDIEREAHAILAGRRCNGEWFDVPTDAAVAAIAAAAHRLKQPIQELKPWMVAETLRVGAAQDAAAGHGRPLPMRILLRTLQIIVGIIVSVISAIAIVALVWFLHILFSS